MLLWLCRTPCAALTIWFDQSKYLFGPRADTDKSRSPTNFTRGYQHFGPCGKYPYGPSRYSRTSLYWGGQSSPFLGLWALPWISAFREWEPNSTQGVCGSRSSPPTLLSAVSRSFHRTLYGYSQPHREEVALTD